MNNKNLSLYSVVFILLLVSALFRLVYLDLMEFKYDEVAVLELASFWKGIPAFGIVSGIGARNPPGFIWFLKLFTAADSPLFPAAAIAIANVAAVSFAFFACLLIGNRQAGVTSAALMACHPWLILFSRKIWAQSLLPPVIGLILLVMSRNCRKPGSSAVFWLLPLVCIAWQLHYSAYSILLPVVSWLVVQIFRKRINIKFAFSGAVLSVVLLVPYLGYLRSSNYADLQLSAAAGGDYSNWLAALRAMLLTSYSGGLGFVFTGKLESLSPTLAIFESLGILIIAAFAALGILRLKSSAKEYFVKEEVNNPDIFREQTEFPFWLLLFCLMPPILYLAKGLNTPPHYYIVSAPALIMLAGIGASKAIGRDGWLGAAARCGVLSAPLCGAVLFIAVISKIEKQGGSPGDYGTTYRAQKKAAEILVNRGIVPEKVDARFSRDGSIGVFYMMKKNKAKIPINEQEQARIYDLILFPELACVDSEEALYEANPLVICIGRK